MKPMPASTRRNHLRLIDAWLLLGAAILLLTPLPTHTATLGWAPTFWLLIAPLWLHLVLEPGWPLRLLAQWLRRH